MRPRPCRIRSKYGDASVGEGVSRRVDVYRFRENHQTKPQLRTTMHTTIEPAAPCRIESNRESCLCPSVLPIAPREIIPQIPASRSIRCPAFPCDATWFPERLVTPACSGIQLPSVAPKTRLFKRHVTLAQRWPPPPFSSQAQRETPTQPFINNIHPSIIPSIHPRLSTPPPHHLHRQPIPTQPFTHTPPIMPSATGSNWEKYQKKFADDEVEEKKIVPLSEEYVTNRWRSRWRSSRNMRMGSRR